MINSAGHANPRCPECHGIDLVIDYSAGDNICRGCGFIVADRIIDERNEMRQFCNDAASQARLDRVGDVARPGESCLSTEIGGTDAKSTQLRKLHFHSESSSSSSNTTTTVKHQSRAKIQTLGTTLGISPALVNMATDVYALVVRESSVTITSKTIDAVVAAVLYIACRKTGQVHTLKEFESASGVEKKKIGKVFKLLTRTLDLEVATTSTAQFIERFCMSLNLPRKTQLVALGVASNVCGLEEAGQVVLSTKAPVKIAASVIYLVASISNMKRSLDEIARISTVSNTALKALVRELNQHRFKLFEGIVLK